jgi:hypothetical protein
MAELRARGAACKDKDVEINMTQTQWFSAQMCAPFGAVLYELEEDSNTVRIANINPVVEKALSENKFLGYYGGGSAYDEDPQVIPYKRFRAGHEEPFYDYVRRIVEMKGMKKQTAKLRRKFQQGMSEIFSNVSLHARSELGFFVCANFADRINRLSFVISDLGVGIGQKVNDGTGQNLTTKEAIEWAINVGNTTKKIPENLGPGGLGLALLADLIDENDGRLKIVSGNCFWRYKKGVKLKKTAAKLKHDLLGTTVVVEINMRPPPPPKAPRRKGVMEYHMPEEINSYTDGFDALAKLRAEAIKARAKEIEINMGRTWWFSAQMCAPLGAILRELEQRGKSVHITNIDVNVEKALSQNGFLSKFSMDSGDKVFLDKWGTVIPYREIGAKELAKKNIKAFEEYIVRLYKKSIPHLREDLRDLCRKRLSESLSEFYLNFSEHAESNLGVFICGQLYYGRNALSLVVSDLGIGIRESVNRNKKEIFSTEEAIEWAMKRGNSSKSGFRGWGLDRLAKFVDDNGGVLNIVSGNCFWQYGNGQSSSNVLESEIPGTTVVVEINTKTTAPSQSIEGD